MQTFAISKVQRLVNISIDQTNLADVVLFIYIYTPYYLILSEEEEEKRKLQHRVHFFVVYLRIVWKRGA